MPSEIKSSFTYWCFWYAGVQVTVISYADIFWAHHAICLSHDRHSAEANGTFLPFCFRPSRSQTLDPEKFERDSLKKRTQAWPFLDVVNIKSVDLITLWATGCKVFQNTWRLIMDIFVRGRSFATLFSDKIWLKCWKPAEINLWGAKGQVFLAVLVCNHLFSTGDRWISFPSQMCLKTRRRSWIVE